MNKIKIYWNVLEVTPTDTLKSLQAQDKEYLYYVEVRNVGNVDFKLKVGGGFIEMTPNAILTFPTGAITNATDITRYEILFNNALPLGNAKAQFIYAMKNIE